MRDPRDLASDAYNYALNTSMYSENEWHQPVDRGIQTYFIVTVTLTQTIKYLRAMHQSNINDNPKREADNFLKIHHEDNKENISE